MPEDTFRYSANSATSPADYCFAIVPDDAAELPRVTKGIYVGQDGDVTLIPARGDVAVTFRNVLAGSILDIRARLVKATGTTAAFMVGLA